MLRRYFVANDNVIVDGLGFMRPRLKQSNYKKCFNKKFFSMNFCLGMHSWDFQLPPPPHVAPWQPYFFHSGSTGEKEIRWSKQISRWSLQVAWRMAKIRRVSLSLSPVLSLTHTHIHIPTHAARTHTHLLSLRLELKNNKTVRAPHLVKQQYQQQTCQSQLFQVLVLH